MKEWSTNVIVILRQLTSLKIMLSFHQVFTLFQEISKTGLGLAYADKLYIFVSIFIVQASWLFIVLY